MKKRLVEIDFLRGIAILLVIGYHGVMSDSAGRLDAFKQLWHHIGWSGVDLFFVLSGFLVGGLLLQEIKKNNTLDIKRFIIRRAFKIFPSYYFYLVSIFIYYMLAESRSLKDAFLIFSPNIFNFQNYNRATFLPIALPHTWSLAVEEHFYLILPLSLALIMKQGAAAVKRWVPLVASVSMLLCLIVRCARPATLTTFGTLQWSQQYQWPTHMRLDSLFFGVLLACIYHFYEKIWEILVRNLWVVAFLALGLLVPPLIISNANPFVWTIGYTFIAGGYSCLLILVLALPLRLTIAERFFCLKIVRLIALIGTFSYSIYLWHIVLGQLLPKWFIKQDWLAYYPELRYIVTTLLYVSSASIVGIIFGKLIEFPALFLRDKVYPAKSIGSMRSEAIVNSEH